MKHLFLPLILVVILLIIAGCTQTTQQGQPVVPETSASPVASIITTTPSPAVTTAASVSGNIIVIQKMAFTPAQITISTGTMVRWFNKDTVTHSVAFPPADKIDSIAISPGQIFTVRFDHPGVYNYSDSIYPGMQGAVIVT
jgi:plastocyanin